MVYGTTFPKHRTFAYRQLGISLRNQPLCSPMSSVWVLAHFSTALYGGTAPTIFRLGTRTEMGPGAFFACGPTRDIIECLFQSDGPGSHCRDSAHDRVRMGPTAEHRAP